MIKILLVVLAGFGAWIASAGFFHFTAWQSIGCAALVVCLGFWGSK